MGQGWVRAIAGIAAFFIALAVGLIIAGPLDFTADENTGVIAGVNTLILLFVIALVVSFIAYAATEYAQTKRLDSITSQFSTRVIVMIPIAIAINIILGQTVSAALKIPIYLDSIGTILVGVLAGPFAGALTGLLANTIWTYVLPPPLQSPYAAPFAIVAVEIGLLAGFFGRLGFFRSRPNTPWNRIAIGAVAVVVIVAVIGFYGFIPFYTDPDTNVFNLAFFAEGADPIFVIFSWLIVILLIGSLIGLLLYLFVRRDLGAAYVFIAGLIVGIISAIISAPISALVFGGVTGSGTDLLVAAFQQAGSDLQTAVLQQGLLSDPIDKTVTFFIVFALLAALSRRFVARFPQGEAAVGLEGE